MVERLRGSLDHKDRMFWAKTARARSDWLRVVAPARGLDAGTLVLGHTLRTIIGDDGNCFHWDMHGVAYTQSSAQLAHEWLVERIDWEVSVPELPERFRGRLSRYLERIRGMDWKDRRQYMQAKRSWFPIKNDIERQSETTPELQRAIDLYGEVDPSLSEEWSRFIFGEAIVGDGNE